MKLNRSEKKNHNLNEKAANTLFDFFRGIQIKYGIRGIPTHTPSTSSPSSSDVLGFVFFCLCVQVTTEQLGWDVHQDVLESSNAPERL